MATTQNKRTVHRTQPKRRVLAATSNPQIAIPRTRVIRFPQAKGKLVEEVYLSSEPGHENISINFNDKTCLNFVIEPGFTLKTDYSDWTTEEQRIVRAWPPIESLKS